MFTCLYVPQMIRENYESMWSGIENEINSDTDFSNNIDEEEKILKKSICDRDTYNAMFVWSSFSIP